MNIDGEHVEKHIGGPVRLAICAVVIASAMTGCAVKATKPTIPEPGEGAASTLVLDSEIAGTLWTIRDAFFLEVTVDGFSPTEYRYLPKGHTTLRLAPGSHELLIEARMQEGNSPYYFNPTQVNFETEAGKSYAIKIERIGSLMKPGYGLKYQGWPKELTAGWPFEVYIANPLFSRIRVNVGGIAPPFRDGARYQGQG